MNHLDITLLPNLLEESRRELERERERKRQIRELAARRVVERPSRFAALTARLRGVLKRNSYRPLVEGC